MFPRILVAEKHDAGHQTLGSLLETGKYTAIAIDANKQVPDMGRAIVNAALKESCEAIVLDMDAFSGKGFEVCRELIEKYGIEDIPIVLVGEGQEPQDVNRALELGASDYIRKPYITLELFPRLNSAIRHKYEIRRLKELASRDQLTGLYNHGLLLELFEKEYKKQLREEGNLAFAMMDIDFFKKVNDTYGHPAGNSVLKELAALLQASCRESDILGRYGGEEFSLILPGISREKTKTACERIRRRVENHVFSLDGNSLHITLSIGICHMSGKVPLDPSRMMHSADMALYKAKDWGRNKVVLYEAAWESMA